MARFIGHGLIEPSNTEAFTSWFGRLLPHRLVELLLVFSSSSTCASTNQILPNWRSKFNWSRGHLAFYFFFWHGAEIFGVRVSPKKSFY